VHRALLTLLAVAVFALYVLINQINMGRVATTLDLPIDHWIPVISASMLVYPSVYFFSFVPVAQVRPMAVFARVVYAYCALNLIGLAVFTYYPVMVVRPPVEIHNFFDWGLAFNYALDPPYNSFPSLHVANVVFVSLTARRLDRPIGNIALGIAVAVAFSTLLTKQHWIADVLFGLPLGWAGYHFIVRPVVPADAIREELTFPRWYLAVFAAGYGLVLLFFAAAYYLGWQPF
jgi:membrane-associated phospholipid phosphatase